MKNKTLSISCFVSFFIVLILVLLNEIDSLAWVESNIYIWPCAYLLVMSVIQIFEITKKKYMIATQILIKYIPVIVFFAFFGLLCLAADGGANEFAAGIHFVISACFVPLTVVEYKASKNHIKKQTA